MGCLPPINSCRISQPSTVWLWWWPPMIVCVCFFSGGVDTTLRYVYSPWIQTSDRYLQTYIYVWCSFSGCWMYKKPYKKLFPWDLQANIHAPMSFMLLVYLVFNAWHFLIYVDFLDHDVLVHVFDLAGSDDPLLLVPLFFCFFCLQEGPPERSASRGRSRLGYNRSTCLITRGPSDG